MEDEDYRQILTEHHEKCTPCEVTCDTLSLVVSVSTVSHEIAITRRVNTARTHLTGWWAFRLNAITELQSPIDADDISAAMSTFNQKISSKLPFKASTMRELAERVCNFFPIVIFNGKSTEDGTDGIAGTIESIDGCKMHVREISTRYRWMRDLLSVDLNDLNSIVFGSYYENELSKIGRRRDFDDNIGVNLFRI